MKKRLTIPKILWVILASFCLWSCKKTTSTDMGSIPPPKLVPLSVAKQIAASFNAAKFQNSNPVLDNALTKQNTLLGRNVIISDAIIIDKNNQPALYVFNFDKNQGFIIVSADYNLRPVLGYINNGEFSFKNMPDGFKDWVNRTVENVEVTRAGLYDNSKEASLAWNRYMEENKMDSLISNKVPPIDPDPCNPIPPPYVYTVGPLLPVTWGQSCTYNDLCALNQNFNCNNCSIRPLTGCVATSMSMLFRYHQFPNTYNWANMPATFGNASVQQLMSDAGVSVSMSYGCNSSGAQGNVVAGAIKNSFGYSSANYWSYSASSYNNGYGRVKDNIFQHNWPVILQGQDQTAGGHQWVCDGAQEVTYYICEGGIISETYLYFHMNWGWHEDWMNGTNATDYNGWFAFDNWYIPGLNWNFQYNRYAISEIHP
ncbi:MAG: C10 family peptidase [Bacteroidetes bacterium]|nr:C10 family peptidase [Bacteroidota bacterium]